MSYPKPCDRCGNDEGACNSYVNCSKYRAWINWSWAQYRSYPARRFAEMRRQRLATRTSWTYYHPDELRQSLNQRPCDNCWAKSVCWPGDGCEVDWLCAEYRTWFRLRVEDKYGSTDKPV